MSSCVLIKGGEIASEDSPNLVRADVLIEGDKITRVANEVDAPEGTKVIDATGKIVMPGLFDTHVHFREPGQEGKESIETGGKAALNGGVTGVVMMPNTTPAIDSAGLVQSVLDIAEERSPVKVYTSGCITMGRKGAELAPIADMKSRGAVMITDDGDPVSNPLVLRRAMEYAREFDLMAASHCEVKELSGTGCMHEGAVSYKLGLVGIPACSEEICLARDIRLAQTTGAHVHIQHVTTAAGMGTIRRYKEEGVRVTAEVAPHHLIFNENDIGDYDTNYKMNPPLRTPEDNELLLQGLIDGVFDIIATDHAPHSEFEKSRDFGSAPFGITGLETALPSLYQYFVKTGKFGWDLVVKRYSAEPRRLIGHEAVSVAEGQPAELIVFDPNKSTKFTREFMESKSSNTPFVNQELDGHVAAVVLDGKVLLNR